MMRWIGLGLVVLAVAGWLIAGRTEVTDPLAGRRAHAPAVVSAPLPTEGRLGVTDPRTVPRSTEALAPAVEPPVAAQPPSAHLLGAGKPLVVSGLVLDAAGAPLAGADVWFLPRGRLLKDCGYATTTVIPATGMSVQSPALVSGVPLADLPHAVTDAGGAFTLSGSDATDPDAFMDPYPAPPVPQIVIRAEGFAARIQPIPSGEERTVSLPDLRLRRAGAVAGRVVDEAGRPVSGVSVRLAGSHARIEESEQGLWYWPQVSMAPLHAVTTGGDGAFRLDALWPGSVDLDLVLAGHARGLVEDVAVAEDTVTEAGDVVLVRGAAIDGRVLDGGGQPVAGASVFATAREVTMSGRGCVVRSFQDTDDSLPLELETEWWRNTCCATTDAAGRFRIEGLLAPTVTLYARGVGFEAARLRDVPAGARNVAIRLQPEAWLDVRVRDSSSGAPVAAATVRARRMVGPGHDDVALRVEHLDGLDRVHGVGSVGTRVHVSAPGCTKVTVELPGQKPGATADTTVELVPEVFVGGRITGADGAPVANARVRLIPAGAKPWLAIEARSDASGAFRYEGLAPGQWSLAVTAEGFAPGAVPAIECGASERRTDADVVLQPGAVVEGFVHALGTEGPRYDVEVERVGAAEDDADSGSAWSEPDGSYRIADLPAGEYRVFIEDVGARTVTLRAGERSVVDFGLQPPRIVVRVLDGGVPREGVLVETREPGETYGLGAPAGPSDADGIVSFLLQEPGDFELVALLQHEERNVGPLGIAALPAVGWGEQRQVDLVLGTGRIAGTVISPDGPFAGEQLWVQRDGDGMALVTTDEQGRFVLEHLLGGEYDISSNGSCEHRRHIEVESGPIELAEHGSIEGLVLQLAWGAGLEGRVNAATGVAAPESSVVYIVPEGESESVWGIDVSAGRYSVSGLTPGAYRACAHRENGWVREHTCTAGLPVTLREGEPEVLDLTLRP